MQPAWNEYGTRLHHRVVQQYRLLRRKIGDIIVYYDVPRTDQYGAASLEFGKLIDEMGYALFIDKQRYGLIIFEAGTIVGDLARETLNIMISFMNVLVGLMNQYGMYATMSQLVMKWDIIRDWLRLYF